jgi:hypothetical protein
MILAPKTIPSGRPPPVCYPQPVIRYILSFVPYLDVSTLTLCLSYLNPYCLGRIAAFFSVGI